MLPTQAARCRDRASITSLSLVLKAEGLVEKCHQWLDVAVAHRIGGRPKRRAPCSVLLARDRVGLTQGGRGIKAECQCGDRLKSGLGAIMDLTVLADAGDIAFGAGDRLADLDVVLRNYKPKPRFE